MIVSIMWNQTIESNIPINEVSFFREIIHSGTFLSTAVKLFSTGLKAQEPGDFRR
tara:strand:- start:332 stop:496 length:165 start_codon:yes stop_codon:yes gene_type:complete